MKPSSFTVILTFVILMIVGVAVAPLIDVGTEPTPRQGKTMTIRYEWPHVAAKVIEQNLTSPVEGMVSALKGVESVSSTSYFGESEIVVKLKEKANVSTVRFEISSLLRQSYGKLPQGISFPTISGGEVVNDQSSHHDQKLLLTYQVNADMQPELMKEYVEQHVKKRLDALEGVGKVEIAGTMDSYVDVCYDPMVLSAYGVTAHDMAEGIRNYIGQDEIVGTVVQRSGNDTDERITLHLTTASFGKALEQMPLKNVGGKMIYLNDLASIRRRDKEPDEYYRVNGLNTIYINVYIPADGKVVAMSDAVQQTMRTLKAGSRKNVYFSLSYDNAKQQREEMSKLISRTLMSLAILLMFVWLTNRDWKYLLIIASTLAANLLIAIIAFWMFHLKLHVYSLAGITVSLGLIIDSTIVMADHYGYYRDRRAFLAILAAMLTTMGSMVIIFFLPKEMRQDLYDFAWIVIVNLGVSLLVALFFVPAIIDKWHYTSRKRRLRHGRGVVRWNRFYQRYITFTSRHRWVYYILLVLACVKPVLMFMDYLDANAYRRGDDTEKVLHLQGRMPVGGTATQLNSKMIAVEELLKKYDEIKEFVTRIDGRSGEITVKFKKKATQTSFPYRLENDVIGKVITIGGADWATYGVSERGFSNALNLQHRSERITVSGYNYDQLYRLAEDMGEYLGRNRRVQDIIIETPGYENQEEELYMRYDKSRMSLYGMKSDDVYQDLGEILMPTHVGFYKDGKMASEVYLTPRTSTSFDLWHLENEQLQVDSSQILVPEMMSVKRREAKNVIPKQNQEYVLNVAFNVMGSYNYTAGYIEEVIKHYNQILPVGYRCENQNYWNPVNESTNYWLLALVAVIVFFLCAIQFESIRIPIVILSVVPVAMVGTFLTFCLSGMDFGSGGFASLVLLMGIVVNSGIYILSQYRQVCRMSGHRGGIRNYVCAYSHKIIPIFLTIASTIMGLIPFFLDGQEEPFWLSFATGVTGGLLFSIPALVFVMPLFINFKRKDGNES